MHELRLSEDPRRRGRAAAVFREEGDYWTLAYGGTTVRMKTAKGLCYIAHLLAHPGEDVHVAALAAVADESRAPCDDGDGERLRKAVGNRIHDSLARIAECHELLGRHLANAIRTGLYCSYRPERRTAWQVTSPSSART